MSLLEWIIHSKYVSQPPGIANWWIFTRAVPISAHKSPLFSNISEGNLSERQLRNGNRHWIYWQDFWKFPTRTAGCSWQGVPRDITTAIRAFQHRNLLWYWLHKWVPPCIGSVGIWPALARHLLHFWPIDGFSSGSIWCYRVFNIEGGFLCSCL
jgi:hypothetical protein